MQKKNRMLEPGIPCVGDVTRFYSTVRSIGAHIYVLTAILTAINMRANPEPLQYAHSWNQLLLIPMLDLASRDFTIKPLELVNNPDFFLTWKSIKPWFNINIFIANKPTNLSIGIIIISISLETIFDWFIDRLRRELH